MSDIAYFTQSPHEGIPHGVPSGYSWYAGPVVQDATPPGGYSYATPWGQVYVDSTAATTAPNTRVEIGRIDYRIYNTSTNRWSVTKSCTSQGAWYPEDFQGSSIAADARSEPDGNYSVTAGNGRTFHFFPANRVAVDPLHVGGVITTVYARLIVADPSKPDDRATARYMMGAGADWWTAVTAGTNDGATIGRFGYITNDWKAFHATTMTGAQLNANPPN